MPDHNANNEMKYNLSSFRPLISEFKTALHQFQASESKFRVLKTIHPSRPKEPKDPRPTPTSESPKTLFILDSSFNPPSIAHKTLAESALHLCSTAKHKGPYRLLLLFATMNADKDPAPAAFEQRIAMMTVFASDLVVRLQDALATDKYEILPIDIGVTKVPYYTDKTLAITKEGRDVYPDEPKHVHLIGFDTLTRFFNPKYYASFDPPLSALAPYFDAGHYVRATLRPDQEFGSVEEQQADVSRLGNGELEYVGGKREWAKQVDVVEEKAGLGVSSTKIRQAVLDGSWGEVRQLCTPGVAAWLQTEELYVN